jgi:WD40 repeat protein
MVALIISCSSQAISSPIPPPASTSTNAIQPAITSSPSPTELTILVPQVISVDNAHLLTEVRRLTQHDDDIVGSLAFNPDGSILATSGNANGNSGNIRLWNPKTGELLAILQGHTGNVNALAFSPDGAILASGSSDNTIRLWNVSSRKTIAILQGHTDFISCINFSPDGRWLASGSQDRQFILWDLHTQLPYATLTVSAGISSIAFRPNSTQVAVAVWGATPDILLLTIPSLSQSNSIDLPEEMNIARAVTYSPDGKFLAVATATKIQPAVQVFDLRTNTRFWKLEGHSIELNSVAYSPDENLLVSTSADTSVIVWNAQTGDSLITLHHDSNANNAIFSPDGTLLATAGSDRTVRIWSIPPAEASAVMLTQTAVAQPTRTPAPTRVVIATPNCDEGFSRLAVGQYAVVSQGDLPNRVRTEPRVTTDNIIALIYSGTIGKITGGPVCADGLVFWKIESDTIPSGSG